MESEFWVYCWKHGSPKVKAYVWSRKDLHVEARQQQDEVFLRGRVGKTLRARFWQKCYSDSEEEDDPRDEVEILERCVSDTQIEVCAAPDSILLKRAFDSYMMRLEHARKQRTEQRQKKRQHALKQKRLEEAVALANQLYGSTSPPPLMSEEADCSSPSQTAEGQKQRRWRSPSADM
jgi:hypothetical protein